MSILKTFVLLAGGLAAANGCIAAQSAARWLHAPAISPDGSRIAFAYRGDLWVVPAGGGEAVPWAQGPAYEGQPVWAPDGQALAFVADHSGNLDVYVVSDPTHEPRRLTFHSSDDIPSAFSPDGRFVIFSAVRHDAALPLPYPSTRLPSTFRVPVEGGPAELVLAAPAEQAQLSPHGDRWLYAERKGSEMELRKHERSPANWDLWMFDSATKRHRRLTSGGSEHRQPIWDPMGDGIYSLSERSGTFNVWRMSMDGESSAHQLTYHLEHPVRSLSVSRHGHLCYSHDGMLYILRAGNSVPRVVPVSFASASVKTSVPPDGLEQEITEFTLLPTSHALAFVARGEVFLASTSGRGVRRLTHTPALEANLNPSADGRQLAYASERDGRWQIYVADQLGGVPRERRLFESAQPSWLPRFSPDGQQLAYVENDALAVRDLRSAQSRTLLPKFSGFTRLNHAGYDIRWRADGRWLVFPFTDRRREGDKIGVLSAQGGEIRTVSRNAYSNRQPLWSPAGDWIAWLSDAEGLRDYRGNRSAMRVFALPTQSDAVAGLRSLSTTDEDSRQQWGAMKSPASRSVAPLTLPLGGAELDAIRLSSASAQGVEMFAIAPGGHAVLWATKGDGEFELWRKQAGAPARRVGAVTGKKLTQFELTEDGRSVLLLIDGAIHAVSLARGTARKVVGPRAVPVDAAAERVAMLGHIGAYAERVFYDPSLDTNHWRDLVAHYQEFARDAVTRREFVELVNELIGELNASHTEAQAWPAQRKVPQETASLGAVLQPGGDKGWRIAYIAPGSPLLTGSRPVAIGTQILAIDGHRLSETEDWHRWLNGKGGKRVALTLAHPQTGEQLTQHWIALSQEESRERLYRAWVLDRHSRVQRLSGGRLAYSHVQAMDDRSFRRLYDEALNAPGDTAGLIVDTRHNEGGWLHEALLPFLQGRFLFTLDRQGSTRSIHPQHAWTKPSVMLVNSANYSNGYENPRLYRALGIGKVIGTPIAGTGLGGSETTLADGIRVSIANDVCRDAHGSYFEGAVLEPDIRVDEMPEDRAAGADPQLEAAVRDLLEGLRQRE